MAVSQGTLPVRTTIPEYVQRHNISDEELDMLCEGKKDMVLEFLWIAIGILVGSGVLSIVAHKRGKRAASLQQIRERSGAAV